MLGDIDSTCQLDTFVQSHLHASQDPAASGRNGEDDDGNLAIESQLTVTSAQILTNAHMCNVHGLVSVQSALLRLVDTHAAATSGICKAAAAPAKRHAGTADDQTGQGGARIPDRGPRAAVARRGFCPDFVGGPHPRRLRETPLLILQIVSILCGVPCRTLLCQYQGGSADHDDLSLHRGSYQRRLTTSSWTISTPPSRFKSASYLPAQQFTAFGR